MRHWTTQIVYVLLVIPVMLAGSSTFGGERATRTGTRIAVFDMTKLLREHRRLQYALRELQEKRREHEKHICDRRRDLAAQTVLLDELQIGSLEHSKREQILDIALCELEEYDHRKQAEFAKMAAQINFNVLWEIRLAVKQYAERNAIDIVLNYDSSEIGPDKAEQRLGDQVIYQSKQDITEYLSKRLNGELRSTRCCLPPGVTPQGRSR